MSSVEVERSVVVTRLEKTVVSLGGQGPPGAGVVLTGVSAGTYLEVTVDVYGRVTSGANPANLTALKNLTGVVDKLSYFTGSGTMALADFPAFGRSVAATTDAAALSALLSLGTMSVQNAGAVAITGGAIDGTVIGANVRAAGSFTTLSTTDQITSTLVTGTAPLVIASTTVVGNLNSSLLLGKTWSAPAAIGSVTPAAGTFTTLASTGDTTIGDAIGDTLTINVGTITYGSNLTITRAAGTVAAGVVTPLIQTVTATGDAGGTSNIRANFYSLEIQGANAVTTATAFRGSLSHNGTTTLTNGFGFNQSVDIINTGNIANVSVLSASITISSTGGITGSANILNAGAPTITGAGTINLSNGLSVGNIGHAQITTVNGVNIADITGSTNIRGVSCAVSSGTGKRGLNFTGTADNVVVGNTHFGSNALPVATVDITGTFAVTGIVTFGDTTSRTIGNANKLQLTGTTAATNSMGISAWSADALGARIELGKSRGAAIGTNTIVVSGDVLGTITAYGADGTNFDPAASISFESDGTPGNGTDMPGSIVFSTTPDGTGTVVSRVKIGQQGNVILNNSGSALATNATGGFTYIPSCAGAPTGVPAVLPTGAVPTVYDSTNNRVYFYSGAWRSTAVA